MTGMYMYLQCRIPLPTYRPIEGQIFNVFCGLNFADVHDHVHYTVCNHAYFVHMCTSQWLCLMLEMPEIIILFFLSVVLGTINFNCGYLCSPGCLGQLLRVVCRSSLRVGARGKREPLTK